MKFSVQVIVHPDDDGGGAAAVREVFALDRDALAPDTLGLRLAEAQDLLVAVQDTIVAHQVQIAVAAQTACPACGRPRRHKDTRAIVVRSLQGADAHAIMRQTGHRSHAVLEAYAREHAPLVGNAVTRIGL